MLIPKPAVEARIRGEFGQLQERNYALAALMQDLADFVRMEFRKDVVITTIYRTQQEQWKNYELEDGPNTRRTSPHMRWEAVDIDEADYADDEKAAIARFLKEHYDATNEYPHLPNGSRTAWRHAVKGGSMHFHIQYYGPLVYVFSQGSQIRRRIELGSSQTRRRVNVPGRMLVGP